MAKEIKKLLNSLEEDLDAVSLSEEDVVVSVMISTTDGTCKSGQLKFRLKDILDVLRLIDRIITTVRRIRKKLKWDQ